MLDDSEGENKACEEEALGNELNRLKDLTRFAVSESKLDHELNNIRSRSTRS